jgi:hypothetical protein
MVAAAAVISLAACGLPGPSPSSSSSLRASAPASASADLSASADAPASAEPSDPQDGDLARLAWWGTELIGFGVIPEAPPDPNPPVSPRGFRQLVLGTLDGRITAILPLHEDWSHSYVAGPYGSDVLVTNDLGDRSVVFRVSAVDGTRTDLLATRQLVAAAALGGGGRWIYYVELDRTRLEDRGLLRVPVEGGVPEVVLRGPLGSATGDGPVSYWITADPLQDRVVVQWCFGQVRCTSWAVDPRDGTAIETATIGWPLGADATTLAADGLGDDRSARLWDMVSGELTAVPGAARSAAVRGHGGWLFANGAGGSGDGRTVWLDARGERHQLEQPDAPGTVLAQLGERRGVALPTGWAMRWPANLLHQTNGPLEPELRGELVQLETGRRMALGPFEPDVRTGAACGIPAPTVMPSGRPPGFGVLTLLDGLRTVRWGSGADVVVLAVGAATAGRLDDLRDAPEAVIRGNAGRVVMVGDEGVGEVGLTWEEDGCPYTAWLPPGTLLVDALDYASRY